MRRKRFSWAGAFALSCILALVSLVSCDIGNWDITRSPESQRNVNAFEEIDFLTGEILDRDRRGTGNFIQGRFTEDGDRNIVTFPAWHALAGQPVRVGVGAYPLSFGVSAQSATVGIAGGGSPSRIFADARHNATDVEDGVVVRRVGHVVLPEASSHRGNPAFFFPESPEGYQWRLPGRGERDNVERRVVPPGFIEVAAVNNNRGGKIAGSEDGLAFLFREVPLNRNFVMEADFLIVQYGNQTAFGAPQLPGSNGQEGFGIMVRDFVPQIDQSNASDAGQSHRTGTTMATFEINGHRGGMAPDASGNLVPGLRAPPPSLLETNFANHQHVPGYGDFWVGHSGHGSDSNMFLAGGTKRGMNVKARWGITRGAMRHDGTGNPVEEGFQNSLGTNFRWWPSPLPDYSFFTERVHRVNAATGAIAYSEEMATFGARPSFPRWGSTVRVRLERTNDGFVYTITNLDDRFDNIDTETGRLIEANVPKPAVTSAVHGIQRDGQILGMVNSSHFYVGLFAARDAAVWVSNIRYFEAYRDRTAPAQPTLPDLFDPVLEVVSPPFYTGINTLFFTSNTYGRISVLQNGERIPDGLITAEWIDARENGTGVPMTLFSVPIREPDEGDTVFSVLFTPGVVQPVLADRDPPMQHSSNEPIRKTFTITRRSFDSGETCRATGASIIFVAPTVGHRTDPGPMGSVMGDGTRGNPLDLQMAINHVLPGQHIVMLNGRYVFDRQLLVPWFNDGRHGARKVLRAETVNGVWLDWNKREDLGPLWGDSSIPADAFLVRGSFWHFDGFHVRGAPDKAKGITVGGSNNLFTRLSIYNNGDTGFQISFHASIPTRFWPSDNRVMWTESFHNLDRAQTDADGFGAKLTVGERNVFYACIAHHNNDDGWDLFAKRESGRIGVTLVDRSIAYRQGWMLNAHRTAAGGIGFKMGGESIGIFHELKHSLAFGNNTPIGSNSNPLLLIRNSTAINGASTGVGGINITGPAPVGGNAFDSVGTLSRNGFGSTSEQAALQGSNVGTLAPGASTDWRAFMVRRPAEFWGTGYARGFQGDLVNSTVGNVVQGETTIAMPSRYEDGWDQFALFLPRDEYFAYPILVCETRGILFEGPAGKGAYRLHSGTREIVTHWIPWAVPNHARPWNVWP